MWFGEPWPAADHRAPVCEDDRERVEVPVGQRCMLCGELIEERDRGQAMHGVTPDEEPITGYAHAECMLRCIVGNHLHVQGKCHHTGQCNELSELSYRQEALAVWALMQ